MEEVTGLQWSELEVTNNKPPTAPGVQTMLSYSLHHLHLLTSAQTEMLSEQNW